MAWIDDQEHLTTEISGFACGEKRRSFDRIIRIRVYKIERLPPPEADGQAAGRCA